MRFFTFLAFLFCFNAMLTQNASATTVVTKFDYTFCSATYPSPFVTGTIKISASTAGAFTVNQTSKTMDIITPTSFAYNTAYGASVTYASGQAITAASAVVMNSNRMRITLSTANVTGKFDTLYITFQIKALTAPITVTTSYLKRSDSADVASAMRFKIDAATTKPSGSLGKQNSKITLGYVSSAATQASTAVVYTASKNNQLLRIAVVFAGTCGSATVTGFTFNTDGGNGVGSTDATADIAAAKVFYSGTSTTFSTSYPFDTVYNPSGAFVATGTRTLTVAGTYYFWLTYDISNTATSNNKVDAQVTGITVDNTTYNNTTTPTPTGSRTVSTQYYYSRASANWNSTSGWSYTLGGGSCSCYPNGTAYVVVRSGHTITVNGNYSADVVEVQGILKDNGSSVPTVKQSLLTNGTGFFTATSSWNIQSNVATAGAGASTMSKAVTVGGELSIGSGTSLSLSGTADLTVSQGVAINGTLAMNARSLTLSGANASIAGTGSVTGTNNILLSQNKTIASNAALTIAPNVTIASGATITNNGSMTLQGNLVGNAGSSTWINATGATLAIGGALLNTGTFDATAEPNLVNYNGSAQTVKSLTYHNLTLHASSAFTKTLGGDITVNGDLTVSGIATLNAGIYSIDLGGDWIATTSATPFVPQNGTVVFDGTSIISGNATTFKNIDIQGTLTASVDSFTVSGNFTNDGSFNHGNRSIVFNGTTAVLGSSTTSFNNVSIQAGATLTAHDSEMEIQGNMRVNGTFNPNNATVLFNGNINQYISGGSSPTFHNFVMDGAGVSLSTPVDIASSLTLTDGRIVTSTTNPLTLLAGAVADGGSLLSFVKGPLVQVVASAGTAVVTLPIGKGNAYRPVTLTVNHTDNLAASYTAEMFNSPASLLGYALPLTVNLVSAVRFYTIHRDGASNLQNAKVQFNYGAEDAVSDPSHLRIVKTIGAALQWNDVGGAAAGGVISSDWFTSFSTFALANGNGGSNVLPITLSSFTASCNGGSADLNWTTSTEYNTNRFEVERSVDGTAFTKIALVDAAGSSTVDQHYHVVDNNASNTTLYYRLKSIDHDSTFVYSNIVPLSCNENVRANELQVYPNPIVGSTLHVAFKSLIVSNASYCLKNTVGVTVAHGAVNEYAATNGIDVKHLLPGLYWLTVRTNDGTFNQPIVITQP